MQFGCKRFLLQVEITSSLKWSTTRTKTNKKYGNGYLAIKLNSKMHVTTNLFTSAPQGDISILTLHTPRKWIALAYQTYLYENCYWNRSAHAEAFIDYDFWSTLAIAFIFRFYSQVEFLSEADKMKLLSHPNLVKLLAVCTTGEPVYIIMELMIHGKKLPKEMILMCVPQSSFRSRQRESS